MLATDFCDIIKNIPSASQFVTPFLKAYATLHQVMAWQHIIQLNSWIGIHVIQTPWQKAAHKVSRLRFWSCDRIDTRYQDDISVFSLNNKIFTSFNNILIIMITSIFATPPSWIHIYSTYKHIKYKAIKMRRYVTRNVTHTKSISFVSSTILT